MKMAVLMVVMLVKKAEMLGVRIISLEDFLLEDFGTSQPPL
jgi:hypothetical protein